MATLEDGLYVLEKSLADPKMVDKLARFLKASVKGWDYAAANPDEAATIVLDNDATGAQTEQHQKRMMGEINKLVGQGGSKGIGYLDEADFDRTVQVLLSRRLRPGDHEEARRGVDPRGVRGDGENVSLSQGGRRTTAAMPLAAIALGLYILP